MDLQPWPVRVVICTLNKEGGGKMATWCAWCKPMRKIREDPTEIETHGICPECTKGLLRDLERTRVSERFNRAAEILGPGFLQKITKE